MFLFSELLPGSKGMREFDAIKHKTSSQSCNLSQYANSDQIMQNLGSKMLTNRDSIWQGLNGRIYEQQNIYIISVWSKRHYTNNLLMIHLLYPCIEVFLPRVSHLYVLDIT